MIKHKKVIPLTKHYLPLHVILGLLKETEIEWLEFKKNKLSINEAEIFDKIEQRNKAREDKNYKEADKIRDELLDKGVLIEDKDGKTTWKFK